MRQPARFRHQADLLGYIRWRGAEPNHPNGTVELPFPVTFEIDYPMLFSCETRPGSMRAIGFLEGLAMVAGIDVSDLLIEMAPSMEQFADDGVFLGGYGPMVGRQLPMALRKLREDPATRQAVLSFYEPAHLWTAAKNIPCLATIAFNRRNFGSDMLHMHVHMRSNDAWRGFTYDAMAYRILQQYAAAMLDLPVGRMWWTATSMHYYERDEATIREACRPPSLRWHRGFKHEADWYSPLVRDAERIIPSILELATDLETGVPRRAPLPGQDDSYESPWQLYASVIVKQLARSREKAS